MRTLQTLTREDYLLFKVEGDVGYSFVRLAPTIAQQYLATFQGLGFVSIIVSLIWASRNAFSHRQKKPEPSMKTPESNQYL
jgi:hypothetical protein